MESLEKEFNKNYSILTPSQGNEEMFLPETLYILNSRTTEDNNEFYSRYTLPHTLPGVVGDKG